MSNKLISGKNNQSRIVGLEIDKSDATIFIRDEGYNLSTIKTPHRYWILTNNQYPEFIKLKGDLHYKYGRQFKSKEEFYSIKNKLKDKDKFLVYDPREALMIKDGFTFYKDMTPNELSILSFDLETTGIDLNDDSKILVISFTYRSSWGTIEKYLMTYDGFESQGKMIESFCEWVREKDPDIILGHNINSYDIPYMKYIAAKEDVELLLGRDGSALKTNSYESKFRKDGSQFYHYKKHKVYGREIVDTMFLAIKYDIGRKYMSYGLKKIIEQEGLIKKDRTFYDASKIRFNYKDPVEWAKIQEYCKDDSDDALALFDLMAPSLFYLTQSIPKPFQSMIETASGSQLNSLMLRAYIQDGHSVPKASEQVDFEGAISLGEPGLYSNVWKVDVASLYPSIMIQNELYDPNKDPKGYFKEMVKTFTEERLKNKKLAKTSKYHDDLQNAQKIVINSAYGFMGAPGLNFNYPKGAAFVTQQGREILTKAIEWSKTHDFKLVNADTDSISVCPSKDALITENERKALLNELNGLFPERIKFEDDGYYKKVIVLKIKNYVIQTFDGIIKKKGSSIKSPAKEPALQNFIDEIIGVLLK